MQENGTHAPHSQAWKAAKQEAKEGKQAVEECKKAKALAQAWQLLSVEEQTVHIDRIALGSHSSYITMITLSTALRYFIRPSFSFDRIFRNS
jgi:hypothetical protein